MKWKRTILCLCVLAALLFTSWPLAQLESREEPPAAKSEQTTPTASLSPETEAPAPTAQPLEPEELKSALTVRINEAMSSNKACLLAADGSFPDWIELCNFGSEAVDLSGCTLGCGTERSRLDGPVLEAGACCVLLCAKSGGEGLLPLAISADGESLRLWDERGVLCDELVLPALDKDQSFGVAADGGTQVFSYPSPGFENTKDGVCAFQETLAAPSDGLAISEAMVYNKWYLEQKEKYYDWVELVNLTNTPQELSDYYLSDKGGERLLCRLPSLALQPGDRCVLLCDADEADTQGIVPLSLSSDREELYLSRADGSLCDYVSLHDIPLGCSVGRLPGQGGFFYFSEPSPAESNTDGKRFVAEKPAAGGRDGVFNDVKQLSVELTGEGTIRYTTDGSAPTADSPVYQGPIAVEETTVICAVSFEEDSLPSPILSLSYIVNENHSLPVVSLVCDPEELYGPLGIHTNPLQDWEIPCSLAFFEEDGGFCLDAGLKMHGGTSRYHMKKKSFKVNFKDRYDGELDYPLFETAVERFSSILIRSAQETDGTSLRPSTYLRDSLIHKVAVRYYPELPSQDSRFCILYINGEYRGIYDLREAHGVQHFANHYGAAAEDIQHWKVHWGNTIPFDLDYYRFENSSYADDEVFAQATEHLDLDSVIDWLILEAYNGNADANSPNMRFYWNEETQKLYYALVDLDMGMFTVEGFPKLLHSGYPYSKVAGRLLKNAAFRARFAARLREAAEGPLSDENFLALIDELADQLRPEIPRDRELWGGSLEEWEEKVQELRDYVLADGGRARSIISTLSWSAGFNLAEMEEYFPEDLWKMP